MTTIKGQTYQYDINQLLTMDETGLVSSFVLQLDDILSRTTFQSTEHLQFVDETIRFLYDHLSTKKDDFAY